MVSSILFFILCFGGCIEWFSVVFSCVDYSFCMVLLLISRLLGLVLLCLSLMLNISVLYLCLFLLNRRGCVKNIHFDTASCVMYFRGDYRPDWVIFSRRRLLKSDALMSSSIVICIRYFQ